MPRPSMNIVLILTSTALCATGGGCQRTDQGKPAAQTPGAPSAAPKAGEPAQPSASAASSEPVKAAPAQAVPAPAAPKRPVPAEFTSGKPVKSVTTPSGIKIEDLAVGTGMPCLPKANVTYNFIGRVQGAETPFESTYERDEPETWNLDQLLPGLREGMVGMQTGGKRRLTVPPALAFDRYGQKKGDEWVIPPDSTLVFDVELIAVNQKIVPGKGPTLPKETEKDDENAAIGGQTPASGAKP